MPNKEKNRNQAIQAANKELWSRHPELNQRALTMGSEDAALRQEWTSIYRAKMAELEKSPAAPITDGSKPGEIKKTCDDGVLIVHVTNGITGDDIVGAWVMIPAAVQMKQTDCFGIAKFERLAAAEYVVLTSHLPYYTDSRKISVYDKCNLNVALIPPLVFMPSISQTDYSIFVSQYEDSSKIPAGVLIVYLTRKDIMSAQRAMIQALIQRVKCKKPPLTANGVFELARGFTNNSVTALIVSHNVTKALARGRSPIGWSNVSRSPLKYSFNGIDVDFDPSQFHPSARQTGSSGNASVFYAFFSEGQFGVDDEGDWYHFFAQASVTHASVLNLVVFDVEKRGGYWTLDYVTQVAGAIHDTSEQMRDPNVTDSNAYKGWRWANALSYLEEAHYGDDNNEATRESKIHREGAIFGLKLAGSSYQWKWYIPKAGSAKNLDVRVSIKDDTQEIVVP